MTASASSAAAGSPARRRRWRREATADPSGEKDLVVGDRDFVAAVRAMKAKSGPWPAILLLFAAFLIWGFGLDTLGRRLLTVVDGVIVSSRDVPATGRPRYATEYVIRGSDGQERSYTAGATDASLPRSMPVGTQLRKAKWQLSYVRNGETINDFPLAFYSGIFGIALALIVWALLQWRAMHGSRRPTG